MRKTHQLKIRPEFFQAVLNGTKKAEFRLSDRDFAAGDLLCLNEYGPCEYAPQRVGFTGAFVYVLVTHVTDLNEWAPGYVMLSIQRMQMGELCG
ncbi:TPA: DUF3850 domain-containing protein [Salmonella enterica]|nr:hypothetical protein [Salmonella enterica subsp. enterica serovar Enteritidis]EAM8012633.1 DUF3850 domain-containing protein [Salmonella enterica]EBV2387196.1 hypothetical protein [Salmonella enterica subsp. enterica serovar Mississippi]ECI8009869.1 DUF3850 domain-containing protein [Salmonella enterica subsp. enterica]EDD9544332.1 DUF3850 domain-containing protein [Salmonella enterica subsp. enterica serovar Rissen]EHW4288246.1 DUF3850 domain-containing protein [Salmonella enterica subsp. 